MSLIIKDIPYGDHERQKVDIFIPDNVRSETGLILFIHGGGWTSGDKTVHHPDADFFAQRGYICASMNYRYINDELNINHELDDITSAIAAVKKKCLESGFDIDKLILSGGSAGAHLALLYAYTKNHLSPVKPVAACCYCPPSDCTRKDFLIGIKGEFESWKYEILSKACGVTITKETLDDEDVQQALAKISPINYINERCIPTAIFYGKVDELIPMNHIIDFIGKLKEAGIKHDTVLYENSGHALDKDPEAASEAKEVISAYAEEYFK